MSFGTDTGGPAFPTEAANHYSGIAASPGMTLRDYFAAKAIQAFFTDCDMSWGNESLAIGAEAAYRLADAMLKAREA